MGRVFFSLVPTSEVACAPPCAPPLSHPVGAFLQEPPPGARPLGALHGVPGPGLCLRPFREPPEDEPGHSLDLLAPYS